MSFESQQAVLQGFDNDSSVTNDKVSNSSLASTPEVSSLRKSPPLSSCYSDVYGVGDRRASIGQLEQRNRFSTEGFDLSSMKQYDDSDFGNLDFLGGSHSMVLTDSLNDYFPNYGSARKSMLASENGDLGSIENGRYSLSGADYLKNDFENSSYLSFGQDSFSNLSDVQLTSPHIDPSNQKRRMTDGGFDLMPTPFESQPNLSPYPLHRHGSQVSSFSEKDTFLSQSSAGYDNSHSDSFLYSSQNASLPSQSSLLNPPPLPPRNYLQGDFPSGSQRTPPPLPARSILPSESRPYFNSVDTSLLPAAGSARSSASLSSPKHGYSSYWNRSFAEMTKEPHQWEMNNSAPKAKHVSGQLTANAPPFMVSHQNSYKYGKEEGDPAETQTEKKKGSGEDVDINKLLSGEETRSAVMIRNIPNRFSKEELCEILDPFVEGRYTILNMPLDSKTHRNLGYSFIQFHSIDDLIVAYKGLQGKSWPKSESVKRCRFCYAKIQGDPNAVTENNETGKEENGSRLP